MKQLQVGKTKIKIKNKKGIVIERFLSYRDIPKDKDDWVEIEKYLPAEFDLVSLTNSEKIRSGWRSGNVWDGMKVEQEDVYTHWRRQIE